MSETLPHEPTWWEPLSTEQLVVLSKITLSWSRLDDRIDCLASAYLRITLTIWYSIVKEMTLPPKAAMLISITGERADPFSVQARKIAQRVSDIAGDRNLATHGQWNVSQPSGQVEARSRRKQKTLKIEELDDLFQKITSLDDDMSALYFSAINGSINDPMCPPEGWSPGKLS